MKRLAKQTGYHCDFIDIENGVSRINVKMKDFDGTEINGMGPVIDENALNLLMDKLDELIKGDTLVLAGSIPFGMPKDIYGDIMKKLDGRGIRFAVDASNELLRNVLPYHPFLVKPNSHELGELFDTELHTKDEVVPYAKKMQEMGAENVLVSMAGEGAVLVAENGEVYKLDAPEGMLVNAVGAGDSMVAGFLAGWEERNDYEHAFQMAVAAGSASAFSHLLATGEEIRNLYQNMHK